MCLLLCLVFCKVVLVVVWYGTILVVWYLARQLDYHIYYCRLWRGSALCCRRHTQDRSVPRGEVVDHTALGRGQKFLEEGTKVLEEGTKVF